MSDYVPPVLAEQKSIGTNIRLNCFPLGETRVLHLKQSPSIDGTHDLSIERRFLCEFGESERQKTDRLCCPLKLSTFAGRQFFRELAQRGSGWFEEWQLRMAAN